MSEYHPTLKNADGGPLRLRSKEELREFIDTMYHLAEQCNVFGVSDSAGGLLELARNAEKEMRERFPESIE